MWKLLLVLALPLAPLAAAHSGALDGIVGRAASADVQCLIRAEPSEEGVELEGVVASRVPLSGMYEFDVRKVGPGGTSHSIQSGTFEAPAGKAVVGSVALGLESGATYEAKLELRWQGGEVSCEAHGPDEA
jgi:hypothetical protein